MAEMVYRRRRRRKVRMLDEKRFTFPVPTRVQLAALGTACTEAAPGFLLALAGILGMPPSLHAAYIAALAALERPVRWPVAGVCVSMVLRLIGGVDPHWEGVITLAALLCGPLILPGHGNAMLMTYTAASMLPTAIRGWLAPTAMEMVLSLAAVGLAALSAPVMCRGLQALTAKACDGRALHIDAMEDRLGTAMLALMVMCGGSRLLLAGMNAGMLMAVCGVLLLAIHFGSGVGCAAGIISGLCLALTGLPMMLSIALATGGFLAGVMQATGRRWLCCASFAAAALTPMLLTGNAGVGCGVAVAGACLGLGVMPEAPSVRIGRFMQRLRCDDPQPGNAYAACMLAAWEKTVDAMARSVPCPECRQERHDESWWTKKLCEGCSETADCPGMNSPAAADRLDDVWSYRMAEESIWQGALEGLRGLGCQRLYYLQREMESLRQEDAAQQRQKLQAMEQRELLVTHLTAMAGAARRFAHLSRGENWWDAMMARRIRQVAADAAIPARLTWVRRLNGHVHAAFELLDLTGARRQSQELCDLVEAAVGVPVTTSRIDGERVYLVERPPMTVTCGIATACIATQHVCGDTAWYGALQDGRFMAAVSDGMGHGPSAALASQQTVELLRLCLDAGYSLQQTVTAVNGMMLLGGGSERFITVDLLTVDLWKGEAVLAKLGAAGTWLQQDGVLTQMTGDALPLGILESVQTGERVLKLYPGDTLVLMSDGVEEAFGDRGLLRDAVSLALKEEDAEYAAQSLLDAAIHEEGGVSRDDQTVMVLRIGSVGKANQLKSDSSRI